MAAKDFVKQYYDVLTKHRSSVPRFYEDLSTVSRPNLDGVMLTASTTQEIIDISFPLEDQTFTVELLNTHVQPSCNEAVLVLVTGFLIRKDEKKRSFIQTFFLAKNDKGYFVLNDIFRFGIEVDEAVATTVANEVFENGAATLTTDKNQASVKEHIKPAEVKKSEVVPKKVNNGLMNHSLVNQNGPKLNEEVDSKQPNTSSQKQGQETTKMSYASMVAKATPVTSPRSKISVVVMAPSANSYLDQKTPAPLKKKSEAPQQAPTPRRNNAPSNNDHRNEGKSIYVSKLPPNTSAEELGEAVGKYGPIRKDGIQVKTYEDGFCFGFVEFESIDAAKKAIAASKVAEDCCIGSYRFYIAEKKSPAHAGNGKVRPALGKGEVRNNNNNHRSCENSVEGRGNSGRNENGNHDVVGQNRGVNNKK